MKLLTDEEMKIDIVNYEEVPQKFKDDVPDNGCGKEYATYLIIRYKDKILRVESDAVEPEDARFYRDLSWIKDALLEAYNLGKQAQLESCESSAKAERERIVEEIEEYGYMKCKYYHICDAQIGGGCEKVSFNSGCNWWQSLREKILGGKK